MPFAFLSLLLAASTVMQAQDRAQLTWQGGISGSAVLYIQGNRVDVQGRDTGAVDRPTYKFYTPLPAVQQRVDVEVVRGRGRVEVIEQPEPANQFTAVVRIDSPNARRYESYSLEFFWNDGRPGQNRGLPRNRDANTQKRKQSVHVRQLELSAERIAKIGDQVVDIFHTDREPHQVVGDPEFGALCRRHRSMGHDRGMFNQTFDTAQTFGEREHTASLQKPAGLVQSAFDQERDHSSETVHLALRELMLRMGS